jgi:hypothetical protein
MQPLLGQVPAPVAMAVATVVLGYMTLGAVALLRAATRVTGDVWAARIDRRGGVFLASAAWGVGLGGAYVVAQLWAGGLAWIAVGAGWRALG